LCHAFQFDFIPYLLLLLSAPHYTKRLEHYGLNESFENKIQTCTYSTKKPFGIYPKGFFI